MFIVKVEVPKGTCPSARNPRTLFVADFTLQRPDNKEFADVSLLELDGNSPGSRTDGWRKREPEVGEGIHLNALEERELVMTSTMRNWAVPYVGLSNSSAVPFYDKRIAEFAAEFVNGEVVEL
jgi:hypothetical protein